MNRRSLTSDSIRVNEPARVLPEKVGLASCGKPARRHALSALNVINSLKTSRCLIAVVTSVTRLPCKLTTINKLVTTTCASSPVHAVILAGGSGTRLWPLSRQALPKQFVSLFSNKTLLEETIVRLAPILEPTEVTIVTSEAAARGEPMVHLSPYVHLQEPCGRNTAPAIAIAALKLKQGGQDPIMVILPSDHMITNVRGFQTVLQQAINQAEAGHLVTFGITPTRPETGYGYIQCASVCADASGALSVTRFKEKPDLATARQFLADGGYYWNSGMFVWRSSSILAAIAQHLPALSAVIASMQADLDASWSLEATIKAHFASAPSISIDHGVLEKVAQATTGPRLLLIPADIGWSDVGSWDSVQELSDKDANGNTLRGNVIAHNSRNIQVQGGKRLIATIGLQDLSIIDTQDALLVTKRGESQDVRHIVEALQQRAGSEHIEHLTVQRPWGSYTVLEDAPGFKIKRIEVKPSGRLSLQSHQHRSEHWIVVSGVATVTCGEHVTDLEPNESTFIPMGAKHRLENRGSELVAIIEVQVGSYLGEDDIKRYDDQYGRVPSEPLMAPATAPATKDVTTK
jgi:mannose-1-phosphate guanylyltransferase/mannose-6-phosphate isomerase